MSYTKNGNTKTLVFTPPGPDEPGYFRRCLELQEAIDLASHKGGAANWENLVNRLAQYIEGPTDEVKDLLMDATQNQIQQMVSAIVGGGNYDPFGLNGDGKQNAPSKTKAIQTE